MNTTPETNTGIIWLICGAIVTVVALAAWAGATIDTIQHAARAARAASKLATEQELVDAEWRPGLRPALKKGVPPPAQNRAAAPTEGTNGQKREAPR